jgi:hypothetical protein
MNKTWLIVPLALALTACVTTNIRGSSVSETKVFSNEVDYPSWYTEKPSEKNTLFSVGSEFSKDFQFSVDKAMLSAKRELASQFSSHTSSMMKDFAVESGTLGANVAAGDIKRTTRMIVAKVNMIGVHRTNFKVVRERDGYRTFVQLKYSTDEANKILLAEVQRNQALYAKFRASKSFRELDSQSDEIQNQTLEEIRAMQGN